MEKILFIATNAPSIYKDANSIMLQRLLRYFPDDSYYFLSASYFGDSIDNTPIITFFKPYLINLDNKITKFPLFKYTIVNLINNIYGIYQIIKNGKDIISKNDISKIVLVSDNGLCIIGGYLLTKLKKIQYFIYLFDVWSEGYLKPIDKIMAKLLEQRIFKQAINIFTAGEGISQYVFKKYDIKSIVVNNVYDLNNVSVINKDGVNIIHKKDFLFKIIYCGSIYWPQIDSLISLIKGINTNGKIILDLYTNQMVSDLNKINSCFRNNNIHIKSYVSQEKLHLIFSRYDLAFLPLYNYSNRGKVVINTAQPGKLTDYLVSNIPILIHAPEDSFISKYAKKYNFAYVNNDKSPSSLLQTIGYIKDHSEESRVKKANALQIAIEFHNPKSNSHGLLNAMNIC